VSRRRRPRAGEDLNFDDAPPPAELTREAAESQARLAVVLPASETSKESCLRIAQDAVLILRRELAFRVELAAIMPGQVSMQDLIALLRLVKDLGDATRDPGESEQKANYDRLTPAERVQLAALQLKVTYE
jgi:hypothetical protein